jgi:hypothetical protein
MAKCLERTTGLKQTGSNRQYKENGRIRKLRRKIQEYRKMITKVSNEVHRRKQWRKATKKEKETLKELVNAARNQLSSEADLLGAKETWVDKRRMYEIKLKKALEKDKRVKNNKIFKENEARLYKNLTKDQQYTGEVPNIERFTDFWGNIWSDDSKTPHRQWMEKVKEQLGQRVTVAEEFCISKMEFKEVLGKRKNWTAPGIDGIQNFWWKKLEATWQPLCVAMQKWIQNNNLIPEWIPSGRTVLIPKTQDLSLAKNYRPITCLNTSYKIFTGMLARYLKKQADENEVWDKSQMGTCEKVLGTADQLLIDRCIMNEVRTHHRDLAVAYYDYQKAYDMVRHDWILRVFEWMKVPNSVAQVLQCMMGKWRTRLEVGVGKDKVQSEWIKIKRGFLQGDSFSPVGFCLSEVPVSMLIQDSDGYQMGPPGNRIVKRTHSLFIDDLKVYQQNHSKLKMVNDTIVQASLDTGACYGVNKCAEAVFKRGKLEHSEGLEVGDEVMKALEPQSDGYYKFLGCEQSEGIDMDSIRQRLEGCIRSRTEQLAELELHEKHLMKAINTRVVPVAGYLMNICKFSKDDLNRMDMIVNEILREYGMHGRQGSDERLYLPRNKGGRGLKSFRDIYKETKVRVASYMVCSKDRWISAAWRREVQQEGVTIRKEAESVFRELDVAVEFGEASVCIEGSEVPLEIGYKNVWLKLKNIIKTKTVESRIEQYMKKNMQSEVYKNLVEADHQWMECNNNPKKVSAVISMQEQMVETAGWKMIRGLPVATDKCRLCNEHKETVYHWLSGCKKLAGTEYARRHDKALKILCVEWCKLEGLLPGEAVWYKQTWKQGQVFENESRKLAWDFEYGMRTTTTARRPDATLEYKDIKTIYLVDMACPHDQNVAGKHAEKMAKYQQLAFELRERRPGHRVEVIPVVVGCMGAGSEKLENQVKKLLRDPGQVRWTVKEMLKTVLWEGESIIRKVLSGVVQE